MRGLPGPTLIFGGEIRDPLELVMPEIRDPLELVVSKIQCARNP